MKSIVVLFASIAGCIPVIAQPANGPEARIDRTIAALPTNKVTGSNPALLYWQAIAMMPELDTEQVRMIADVVEGGTQSGAGVAAMLEAARKSLARFTRAAWSDEPCDWGTTFDEGPFAPMPHLPKLQLLCRLALAQAELHLAEGRISEALSWLAAVHRAARHLASDTLLATIISQHGIEQQAIRITARHALAMDTATRASHLKTLQALPPLRTLREALKREHILSEWLRHMVLGIEHSPESEKALLDMAQSLLQAQGQNGGEATSGAAKEALASIEEWKHLAEQARAMQTALDAASGKAWPAFKTDMQKVRTDFAAAPPALLGMLPGVEGAMRKDLETQTLHTMLQAVLSHDDDWTEGELAGSKDAFEGHSLIVTKDNDALQISMKEKLKGKALTLRVSR